MGLIVVEAVEAVAEVDEAVVREVVREVVMQAAVARSRSSSASTTLVLNMLSKAASKTWRTCAIFSIRKATLVISSPKS